MPGRARRCHGRSAPGRARVPLQRIGAMMASVPAGFRGRPAAATVWLVAASLLSGCGGERAPVSPARPDLVLVTVDTLRADHLGCYGHAGDISPHVDRLAAEGVRFADATVQWPSTWPSMASMLTGTYPATTDVPFRPRRSLAPRNHTLAEILKRAGYLTGAVVSNANLGRTMRFDQGFDWFLESWQEAFEREHPDEEFENVAGRVKRFTDAAIVTGQALAWLSARDPETPLFLWVHYMDAHGPYVPPEDYAERYAGLYAENRVKLPLIPRYQRQRRAAGGPPVRDLAFYMARYDGEIRYFDDQLGRLLAGLEERWGDAPGLLALTADHGESLDEHDYYLGHGALPFQPAAQVPLLLRMPGRLPAGQVVEAPVALVALAPTLLELLGVAVPEEFQARSLLPWIEDADAPPPPPVFGQAGNLLPAQAFVRRGRFKLVRFGHPDEVARFGELALYDLESDPGETRNAVAEHPDTAAELAQELDLWLQGSGAQAPREPRAEVELDAREQEMLRALGYGQ